MSADWKPGQALKVISAPRMPEKRTAPWKVGDTVTLKRVRPSGASVEIVGAAGMFRIERFETA